MNRRRLRQLVLSDVIEGCHQEAQRFRAGQPGDEGYCLELFRRAIEQSDQEAWTAIHHQYYRLVAHWIGARQDADELIQLAFTKFWRTLRGRRVFRRFSSIGAVLAYLHKCALSARLDLERQEQRERHKLPNLAPLAHTPAIDDAAIGNVTRDALRANVRRWLQENVKDPKEQQVIFLSYDLGLSPAEIARRYPEQFGDVETVRRIKERVLARLRRAAAFIKWLES